MKKKFSIIFSAMLLLFFSDRIAAQNIVPNPSFEYGSGSTSPPGSASLGGIDNWQIGYSKVSNITGNCLNENMPWGAVGCFQTTSWMTYNEFVPHINNPNTTSCHNATTNNYTSRCLHLDKPRDRARVQLSQPIKAWKWYTIRFNMMCYESPASLMIYATHWGLHWNSDKSDNHKTLIASFSPMQNCAWTGFSQSFYTTDDLQNIVLAVDLGEVLIDDVEIVEGSNCPDLLLQQNKYYNTAEPVYEAFVIRAGNNVGAPGSFGVVTVKAPGGNITYKAVNEVSLEDGFSVEPNANFLAYIAPCGRPCFPPEAITGNVTDNGDDLCGNPVPGTTYQLGAPGRSDMIYAWTANPTSALSNLSANNIANPIFTPPTSGFGTIIYTLEVTNTCGETAVKSLTINYATADFWPGSGYISNTSTNPIDWVLGNKYSAAVEAIAIAIYEPGGTTIKKSFVLHRGVDFTGTSHYWTYPYPNEISGLCASKYYPVKLYYQAYCEDVWHPCTSSPPTDFQGRNFNCKTSDGVAAENNIDQSMSDNIAISPNPNNGAFILTVPDNDVKDVYVYDYMGKVVYKKEKVRGNTLQVDISNRPTGIYLVKVIRGDKIISKKIIIK